MLKEDLTPEPSAQEPPVKPKRKINTEWQDERGRFKRGNPGGRRKPNIKKREERKYRQILKAAIDAVATRADLKRLVQLVISDVINCYDPDKFRRWISKSERNETIFYTRILPRFFPTHLDVEVSGDVTQKLSYELVLPHLLEAHQKGILRPQIGDDGNKYIEFE
ncbi:MAG: hypothetical protein ACUVWN_04535, partial [bacterium]